jgi:hypothetical protein
MERMGKKMGYRTRGKHQKGKTGSREKGRSIVEGEGSVGKWILDRWTAEWERGRMIIRGKIGRRGVV